VTLTQLKVFVLVARLGSVKAAAAALGVSEPAVSQALAALRQHLDDPLIGRTATGMELTAAGQRVVGIASQMVSLAGDAEQAVRQSTGAPELLRVVATSTVADAAARSLLQAFTARVGRVEVTLGVATTDEMVALLEERLADVALGPRLAGERASVITSEPLMRYRLVLVGSPAHPLAGNGTVALQRLTDQDWLVDPAATDPGSEIGRLLARLHVPDSRVRVFPNQAAAWSAAAEGAGIAPAVEHVLDQHAERAGLQRLPVEGTPLELLWHASSLAGERRSAMTAKFQRFLATPDAMQAMFRPDEGVPATRFKPPVYVTIWS
jgi:DNA-binding transcriptional LysR family regulator